MSDTIFLKNLHDISRFGELPDGWQSTTIQQLCELGRGRVISQGEIDDHPGSYPVYSSQTSNNGEMGHMDSFDFEGEWITWTTDGANAGTVFHRTGRFNCTNVCGTLNVKSRDSVDLRFLHYHLGRISKNYVSYLGNPKLMNDVVGAIALHLPSRPEQQKIARILTTVDDLIEQTEALIEKYKSIKQGMMHDLFTRGVDSTGQLRPPYEDAPHLYKQSPLGRIPKEWEAGPLGAIADLQVGYAFKSSWFREDRGIPLLRGENVGYGRADWKDTQRLDESLAFQYAEYELQDGDIVIGMDRTFIKSGVKITVLQAEDCPALLVQRVGKFIATRCESDYLRVLLANPTFHADLMLQQKGMDIPHLSKSEILTPVVPRPSSQEQRAIADRLLSMDRRVASESDTVAKLKLQKSGLMQDLLTGKVRVKVDETEEVTADV